MARVIKGSGGQKPKPAPAKRKRSGGPRRVLEKEVYDNPQFLRQLRDAVSSLKVGPTWDLSSTVTPVIREPGPELEKALKTLGPGESWLLEPKMIDGKHAPELVRDIKESAYDLVVIGALGVGRVKDSQIGSVCERVTRAVDKDVLVVKHVPEKDEPEGDTILVGVDFSEPSEAAFEQALAWSRLSGARLRVLHAYEVPRPGVAEYRVAIPDALWADVRRDRVHDTYRDVFRGGAMVGDFVTAVREQRPCEPDFADGLRIQELCDAAVRSAEAGGGLLDV